MWYLNPKPLYEPFMKTSSPAQQQQYKTVPISALGLGATAYVYGHIRTTAQRQTAAEKYKYETSIN